MRLLKVALAKALGHLIDYLPPDDLSVEQCPAGCRVLVPLGSRKLIGIIAGHDEASIEHKKLRPAISLLDDKPSLSDKDMQFLLWASDYYITDPGEVLMHALPEYLRSGNGKKPYLGGWKLSDNADESRLSNAQLNAIGILRELGGKAEAVALQGFGIASNTISSLRKAGVIEPNNLYENKKQSLHCPVTLTTEQRQAVDSIANRPETFTVTLLQGITGSGKTEVYIQLAADIIEQGKQVIILVPEIGLTPQTLGRFQKSLPAQIVTMHSALGDTQRNYSWYAMVSGKADVLIGTRSAILPPCHNLGLIIVDEEHDISYKQHSGFRYNARDLAVIKGKYYQCPVVLGSATPSLETMHNVEKGNYHLALLHKRATGASLPAIELLDLKKEQINSAGLAEHSMLIIKEQVELNKQVLVFVNRRGFAQSLFCYACGWQAMCRNCDARMTLHYSPPCLTCHHCHTVRSVPVNCEQCKSSWLSAIGTGTEQIAESLARSFPGISVIRIDQDSVRGKGQLQLKLHEIRSVQPAILVGTQMLAKGHDFPALSMVIVVGADNGLYSTDFRAIERTCQLLLQVSGRSGRHSEGRVVIQTNNISSSWLQAIRDHDYQKISHSLLSERREAGMPPFSHLILIRGVSSSLRQLNTKIDEHCHILRSLSKKVEVFGPFEPSIQKLARKYRRQLLLVGSSRKLLNSVCRHWQQNHMQTGSGHSAISWTIDVDPYSIF